MLGRFMGYVVVPFAALSYQSNYGTTARAIRLPVGAQTCLNEQMAGASKIYVGTAGWSYKDWEGVFYPPGMSRRKQHPLELVARCFDLVEINTSFYGHIKPEIATLWARIVSDANPNFLSAFRHGANIGSVHSAQR